ncbi:tetraspanin family protein [Ancylostoma ceylanicum]|uniref:Tetraspanin family protein n=1 Tax=Ancylostoma ceylanicum TaxID=53326 RepID=A0A0D6LR40_9BILA|nr:tetraspanin family protein [Ancylostoma ceylanicum]
MVLQSWSKTGSGSPLQAPIQVTSIALIGFGIRTMTEMAYLSDVIGTRELTTAALLMLCLGTCTFTSTPLGLFSVITKQNTMMLTHMVLIFFVGLLSAVCAWLGFNLNSEVNSGVVLHWMNISFLNEYGNPEAVALTQSWDEMQRKFTCCGITDEKNSSEWLTTHWFIAYETYNLRIIFIMAEAAGSDKLLCNLRNCPLQEFGSNLRRFLNHHRALRFCNSFLTNFPEDGVLNDDQRTCIAASYMCSEANERLANEEACQGRGSASTSKETYMHTKGCYAPLAAELHHHIKCIIFASLLTCVISFLSTCVWYALHESSFNSQNYAEVLLAVK